METIKITLDDLSKGKYVFDGGVVVRKQEGVSSTGTKTKTPDSVFEVAYNFSGMTLAEVLDNSLYKLGVNFRSSVRGHDYFPEELTKVDVSGKTGRMTLEGLPVEQQARAIFSHTKFPDESMRQKAIQAFLSIQ